MSRRDIREEHRTDPRGWGNGPWSPAMALALGVAGCGTPAPDAAPVHPPAAISLRRGLLRVGESFDLPNDRLGTPHAAEFTPGDDGRMMYVAESNGVLGYRFDGRSFIQSFFAQADVAGPSQRCTTVALHESSHTLYCAAADDEDVLLLDARSGAWRAPPREWASGAGYKVLRVQGDVLYLAAFDRGLLRAAIAPDGTLGPMSTVLPGTIVGIDGNGTRSAVLDRSRGLRVLEGDAVVGDVPLDAPMLRVTVRGPFAAVAMGSRGAAVVDLRTPVVTHTVDPNCVVTSADVSEDLLAVGCMTGVYAYDLRTDPPRLAGWARATFSVLDVRFVQGRLLVDDWRTLHVFRIDPDGHAFLVDGPRGLPLQPGAGTDFLLHNPGDLPLHWRSLLVPPGASAIAHVPPSTLDREVISLATAEEVAAGLWDDSLNVVRGTSIPAIGSHFPLPVRNAYVSFVVPNCAMQWPALEDMAWLASHGGIAGMTPLVVSIADNPDNAWATREFSRPWGTLETHPLSEYVHDTSASETFDNRFSGVNVISGADTTSDYSVDADGRVTGFDRVYRGASFLR